MSFATEVKAEIGQNILKDCCRRAELSALVQLCGSLNINSRGMYLSIRIENATVAKRIWKLLKDSYDCDIQLSVFRKMKLKKNNIYVIQVNSMVRNILQDLTLLSDTGMREHPLAEIVRKECCARAYLAGAFMSSGSVNSPQKTNYHLEITTLRENHARYIQKIMERFYLPAKITQRRNHYVVYLKASEKISDFLRCVGAFDSLMNFEDMRIQRDFRNSLQRLDNCELANEVKTQQASNRQLENIEFLEKNNRVMYLDSRLQEAIQLRKDNPEASLMELCEIYEEEYGVPISKSGMKHRLSKINELAENLREG